MADIVELMRAGGISALMSDDDVAEFARRDPFIGTFCSFARDQIARGEVTPPEDPALREYRSLAARSLVLFRCMAGRSAGARAFIRQRADALRLELAAYDDPTQRSFLAVIRAYSTRTYRGLLHEECERTNP